MDLKVADAIIDERDFTIEANNDDVFYGLDLLREIDPKIDDGDMSVGYDQIWIGDYEYTVDLMSEEQFRDLITRGWFEDDESWSHTL